MHEYRNIDFCCLFQKWAQKGKEGSTSLNRIWMRRKGKFKLIRPSCLLYKVRRTRCTKQDTMVSDNIYFNRRWGIQFWSHHCKLTSMEDEFTGHNNIVSSGHTESNRRWGEGYYTRINRSFHHIADGTKKSHPSVYDMQSTTKLAES